MPYQRSPEEKPPECQFFAMHLGSLLEQDVPGELRSILEGHLDRCGSCSALYNDLLAIAKSAAVLPEMAPQRDLWPEIASRIAAAEEEGLAALQRPVRQRWLPLKATLWPALAAAAVLVAAVLGPLLRSGLQHSSAVAADSAVPLAPTGRTIQDLGSEPSDLLAAYVGELASLRAVFELRRSTMDSNTVAVVEHSLATIDSAIATIGAAMANDPSSYFLARQLQEGLGRKLQVMRRAVLTSGI